MDKNVSWLKVFYDCSVDQYGLVKEVKSKVMKDAVIDKAKFLDRILEVNSEMNPNQMYFEFRKMKVSGLIKELPKKKVGLNHKSIEELRGLFDGVEG